MDPARRLLIQVRKATRKTHTRNHAGSRAYASIQRVASLEAPIQSTGLYRRPRGEGCEAPETRSCPAEADKAAGSRSQRPSGSRSSAFARRDPRFLPARHAGACLCAFRDTSHCSARWLMPRWISSAPCPSKSRGVGRLHDLVVRRKADRRVEMRAGPYSAEHRVMDFGYWLWMRCAICSMSYRHRVIEIGNFLGLYR